MGCLVEAIAELVKLLHQRLPVLLSVLLQQLEALLDALGIEQLSRLDLLPGPADGLQIVIQGQLAGLLRLRLRFARCGLDQFLDRKSVV